jgi:hypothetical protein
MRKKIIYQLILLLIAGISTVSCSLDENLYGVASTEGFVKTEADANFVVAGVYGANQSFDSFKSSTAGLILYSGDDFAFTSTISNNSPGVWINRAFTSSDPYVNRAWTSFYSCINRANSAISAIDPVETIKPEVRSKINGEMTFLRGFSYYYLVRLFGGVPIRIKETKPTDELKLARQSVDSVYAQIFRDFKNANIKCVPYKQQPTAEFGRATKGAAQAMLAQAYLTYANYLDLNGKSAEAQVNYQLASDWCDSVLTSNQYSLIANYADLWDVTKEKTAYNEVIYGIQFTRDATASAAGSKGSEWSFYQQPAERWGISGNNLPRGNGQGQTRLQPWFAEQYFIGEYVGDYRSETTILTGWSGYSNTTTPVANTYNCFPAIALTPTNVVRQNMPFCNKYADAKGVDQRNHENDLFVIRLAEIYLIKAEALNEMGKTADAYPFFNEIRKRARNANGVARTTPVDLTLGLDKENFRLAVFNERGLELVGEGQRFFDCIRMRYPNTNTTMMQWRLETYYPNLPATMKTLPTWDTVSKTWKGGRVYMPNVVNWDQRFLLYPIPTTELDANTNFGNQNPGW